jgi:hypothetical protein
MCKTRMEVFRSTYAGLAVRCSLVARSLACEVAKRGGSAYP